MKNLNLEEVQINIKPINRIFKVEEKNNKVFGTVEIEYSEEEKYYPSNDPKMKGVKQIEPKILIKINCTYNNSIDYISTTSIYTDKINIKIGKYIYSYELERDVKGTWYEFSYEEQNDGISANNFYVNAYTDEKGMINLNEETIKGTVVESVIKECPGLNHLIEYRKMLNKLFFTEEDVISSLMKEAGFSTSTLYDFYLNLASVKEMANSLSMNMQKR